MIIGTKDNKIMAVAICEALGLDVSFVQRIILDLPAEGPVKVYVQMLGDQRLLDIDWAAALGESEVVKCVDKETTK